MKRERPNKTPEESLAAIKEIMVQMAVEYFENNHHKKEKKEENNDN
ncbi:hypothetical protein [Psychrobacillus sp. BM2]